MAAAELVAPLHDGVYYSSAYIGTMAKAQAASQAHVQYLSGWFVRQDGPAYNTAYVDTDASFRRPNVLTSRADDPELCRTVAVNHHERSVPGPRVAPPSPCPFRRASFSRAIHSQRKIL
jgi:hypothetical protein